MSALTPHNLGEWVGLIYGIVNAVLVLGMLGTFGAAFTDEHFDKRPFPKRRG